MTHTITEPRTRTYVVTYRDHMRPVERVFFDHATAVAFAESLTVLPYRTHIMVDGREIR